MESDIRNNPMLIQARSDYREGGLVIQNNQHRCMDLHINRNATLIVHIYTNKLLFASIMSYTNSDDFVLEYANARPRITQLVENIFEKETV